MLPALLLRAGCLGCCSDTQRDRECTRQPCQPAGQLVVIRIAAQALGWSPAVQLAV